MNRQGKSSQRKGRRKVNKCIFEVGDTNKQKLSKVEREKKGENKEFRVIFTQERREKADEGTSGGGSRERMNERRHGGPGLPLEQQASPDRRIAGQGHSREGAAPGTSVERRAE